MGSPKWTRRKFLTVAGGIVGSQMLLAACGSSGSTPTETGDSGSAGGDGGSSTSTETPSTSAPNIARKVTEWNVVTPDKTGGADPLSEYPTPAQYYLPWHVMEPLFHPALMPDGKSWGLVNDLAKDWSFTDPTTLVVELEEGVYFHNGEELTAEHVKFAYDSIIHADPPTRRTAPLQPLGEAEIVDKYTIRWHMPEPNISVLGAMYHLLIPPLARKEMTAEEFEREPIGTGPYRVVSWPRDGIMELEAWEDYRKGKAVPERIVGRTVPDPSTRVLELMSGSAQLAHSVPIEGLPQIQSNSDLEIASLKGITGVAYVMNLFKTDPPLRDRRVRQAMNYAVNREEIVQAILGGNGETLAGPLWPGWLGFDPQKHAPYPYDPEKAKELLEEAGATGITVEWLCTQGVWMKDIEIAQAVANQLSEVGINLKIQPVERARLLADRNEGNYDIVQLPFPVTWIPSTLLHFTLNAPYPDDKLSPTWGDTPEELTRARELFSQASAAADFDEMAAGLAQLHEHVHEEAFWMFTHTLDEMWGIEKATGYRPYPTVYPRWYDHWALNGLTAPSAPAVPLISS